MPEGYLIWGFHTKTLWKVVIEFFLHLCDLLIRNRGKFCPFGEVLSDQSLYIFVATAFPSGIRTNGVKLGLQAFGHALLLGKFFSVV